MGQRFWALMKRRAERSPATMGLPHFGVRFLHSAPTVEMTGRGASFWSICPSVNDCQLPAGIVISSGGTRRYGVKTLGSNETQSREISCHHGLATFQSEISPLRFASVEMTGVWGSVWGNLSPGNDCMLPAGIVISSGGTCRYGWQGLWALMKRRVERSPATMGLPHFGVRFLHSASVEMTGGGVISVLSMHFFTAPFSGSAHDSLSSPGGRLSGGYVSSWLSGRIFRYFFFFMSQSVGEELQHAVKA